MTEASEAAPARGKVQVLGWRPMPGWVWLFSETRKNRRCSEMDCAVALFSCTPLVVLSCRVMDVYLDIEI